MALIKNPEAKDKKGLIDYNCHVFQDALNDVFDRAWEKKGDDDGAATEGDSVDTPENNQ